MRCWNDYLGGEPPFDRCFRVILQRAVAHTREKEAGSSTCRADRM
jgi:hypothetical protein